MTRVFATLFLFLAALLLAPVAHADEARTLAVGGVERSYVLHLPPKATTGAHPLLRVFHGAVDARTSARSWTASASSAH